jgi:hypothetical protein
MHTDMWCGNLFKQQINKWEDSINVSAADLIWQMDGTGSGSCAVSDVRFYYLCCVFPVHC